MTPESSWGPGPWAPVRELGRAMLLDLCAWLGAWPGGVPADVPYPLESVRAVQGGHARLEQYLPPELLRRWKAALGPLLAGGATVDVRLDTLSIEATAPGRGHVVFTELSGGTARRWRLELVADPVTNLVRDAWFTPLEG